MGRKTMKGKGKVVKNNKFPVGGYKIGVKLIEEEDCKRPGHNGVACMHHMFDGPFEVIIYHEHDQNAPVLAVEVVCGCAKIFTPSDPLHPRTVDISGCRGASEGSETVYVDATTSNQQMVMNAIVREALREEGLGPAGTGYQQAAISISSNASTNATKIRATNSSSVVVVDRSIDGTGEEHGSVFSCVSPCP